MDVFPPRTLSPPPEDMEMVDVKTEPLSQEEPQPEMVEVTTEPLLPENPQPGQREENGEIMKNGFWAILQLPSDRSKLVSLQEDRSISMGKFGNFKVSDVLGYPFDIPFEVYDKGRARRATTMSFLESFDIETEEGVNNKNLVDDQTSQKLTHGDIEAMKQERLEGGISGEAVVRNIVQNSASFQAKTEYSKAKYIKKKEKKFGKVFTLKRPSARALCMHFYATDQSKIGDLRVDTLSQMMALGDVRAGGKVLVADELGGLVLSSILDRMQGMGKIMLLHEHEAYKYQDVLKYLNMPDAVAAMVNLPWHRIKPQDDETMTIDPQATNPESAETRKGRMRNKIMRIQAARKLLIDGGWDGLFVATNFNVLQVINQLYPYVGGGRPVVFYSQSKEPLQEAFIHMRTSRQFVNTQLTESWLREYQVPVDSVGGTHPQMRMSGNGGYLLSAIKIIDCPAMAVTAGKGARNQLKAASQSGGTTTGGVKMSAGDLAALLALPPRPQFQQARALAREVFNTLEQQNKLNDDSTAAVCSDMLGAAILAGGIGALGELRVDVLADLVLQRLRNTSSTRLSTRVIYAFLLAGSQPSDAIVSITDAMDSLPSDSDPRMTSRLLTMRGWIRGMQKDDSADAKRAALEDFKRAAELDVTNFVALRLGARTAMSIKDHDTAMSNLTEFVERAEEEKMGGNVPGHAAAYFELVEAVFRKGPKAAGGIRGLLDKMERLLERGINVAAENAASGGEQGLETAASEEAEVSALRDRAERMVSTVRGLAAGK
ncbi:tRNA (adenine(58)-N(1))-methyltransferase non-catalytic subunit TRM6 [Borealophlyctis nickersoniae]|nr:tRNA (adenine(58)-N(1))-methyltransferase non-catalytic subunit TRM6 [Borealophlyctis nickersoniae]